jgi:hypothetical protein
MRKLQGTFPRCKKRLMSDKEGEWMGDGRITGDVPPMQKTLDVR